ncbi:hypothetical protein BY458DRAFT_508770 [Sporodiniella umbellata]|nr:hypothetical protein BY458DRAFT_508770 [Sporodiniella umbellata]
MSTTQPLIADLLLPELERQLKEDKDLWPNIKGLFIVQVNKKKKAAATWYLILQGNTVEPIITADKEKAQAYSKLKKVRIQVEDNDLLNFITGGLTGVKAYVAGKIKVRGDLILAQKLEQVFEKAGGRDRAIEFMKKNEALFNKTNISSL